MRLVVGIILMIGLFACGEEKAKPDYIWSEDDFIEVLTEVQMAEAIVRLGYHRSKDSLIPNDSIYNAVFHKMGITKVEFDSNYNYYLNDPEKLESIYDEVIANLSRSEAELKGE